MASTRGPTLQGGGNQPKTALAVVYALTPSKADNEAEDANVEISTIPLFGSLACTLFDSGATHSFVSATYAKLCDMNMEHLSLSILASFCVWTKSLKCKDAVNRDSTIQNPQVRRIQVPCQPSGRPSVHCSIHPDDVSSRPDVR
jgi:hypothetical protein